MESVIKVFPELSKIYQLSIFQQQIKSLQVSIRQKNQNDLRNIKQLGSLYLYGANRLNQKIRNLDQKEKNNSTNQNSYRQLTQNILEDDIFIKRSSVNFFWCRCTQQPTFYYSQEQYLAHISQHPLYKSIYDLEKFLNCSSHLYIYKKMHENPYFNMDQLEKLYIINQLDFSKFYLCICNQSDKYFATFSQKEYKKHLENDHFSQKSFITTHKIIGTNIQVQEPIKINKLLQNSKVKNAIKDKSNQIIQKIVKHNQLNKINFQHLYKNFRAPLHKNLKDKNKKKKFLQYKGLLPFRKNTYCIKCEKYISFPYRYHEHKIQETKFSIKQQLKMFQKELKNQTFYLCSCNNVVMFYAQYYKNHLSQAHKMQAPPYSSHFLDNNQLIPNPSYSKQQLIQDALIGKGMVCGFCLQKRICWHSHIQYYDHILNSHQYFHPQSSHFIPGLKDILLQSCKF